MRTLFVTSTLVAAGILAAPAFAVFDGPAPLAWRWAQPAQVVPGTPVCQGDTVFLAVGRNVYALDRATGNQKWKFPSGAPIPSGFQTGVVATADLVIAAADDRNIYAVDAKSGELKWSATAPAPLMSAPVVCGTLLVLPLGDNSIYALNIGDGQPAWTNATRIFNGIKGTTAGHGGNVLIFDQLNKLYSIDAASKKVNWEVRFNELGSAAVPVIYDETIYVTSGPFVVGINPLNGSRKGGQFNFGETVHYPAALNTQYVASATREGRLIIVDRTNPRKVQKVELGAAPVGAPTFIGKLIGINTSNGSMNVVDPATGKIVWNYILRPGSKPVAGADGKVPPNYMTASAPLMVSGDTLFLQSRDGNLLAFDKNDGVDLTAPTATLIFPLAGSELNPQYGQKKTNAAGNQEWQLTGEYVSLYFSVDDLGSGLNLSTVKVTANGQALEALVTREGYVVVNLGAAKNTFATRGRMVFNLTAADWMGNSASQKYTLTFDSTIQPTEKPGTASAADGSLPGGRRQLGGGG